MKNEYLEENDSYISARKRVKQLRDLYYHIIAYVFLIPFWVFINYKTYWEFKWFWIPVVAMGGSIIVHVLMVFRFSNKWEDRKVRELMNNDNL